MSFTQKKTSRGVVGVLAMVMGLGILTAIAAYTPLRDFLFGSSASTPTLKSTEAVIAKEKLPITGTFITPDLFYKSEDEYRSFYKELSDTGVDSVILMLTSQLSKNCATKKYTEDIDYRIYAGSPQFIPLSVKLAKEFKIKVYFSIAQYNEQGDQSTCFNYRNGTVSNENSDMGRLIGFTSRTIDAIKNMVTTKTNVAWTDPTIAGFYLFPEVEVREFASATSPTLLFFQNLTNKVKEKEPNKKLIISSFQSETSTYSSYLQSYSNLMRTTKIDIYAPQDSMGSQLTRSYGKSSEHFKALRDASVKYPGHEVWANIETFSKNYVLGTRYGPSNAGKVTKQVEAAKPYVTKMITWMYTHTMLSNPLSDNKAKENIYAVFYKPEYAVKRISFRQDYLAYYGAVPTKINSVSLKSDRVDITGVFGNPTTLSVIQFVYVNNTGSLVRLSETITATGSTQSISIPRSKFTAINATKPYTAFVEKITTTSGTVTPTPSKVSGGRWMHF